MKPVRTSQGIPMLSSLFKESSHQILATPWLGASELNA